MKSKICEMLNVEFPLVAFSHCRDVVAAVSRAGGFGVLGATAFTPDQLEVELAWIDAHVGDKPYRLLAKVKGLDLAPLANTDRCCGFGGTFSIKNAEVSSAMLSVKLQDVTATGAEYCTAHDNSCLMHLRGAMHRQYAGMKTIHMAQILACTKTSPTGAFL